jgi:hypothetical protein
VITGEQEDPIGGQDHALRPSVEVGVNRADDSTHLAECILLPGREDRSNRHVAKVQVFEWS